MERGKHSDGYYDMIKHTLFILALKLITSSNYPKFENEVSDLGNCLWQERSWVFIASATEPEDLPHVVSVFQHKDFPNRFLKSLHTTMVVCIMELKHMMRDGCLGILNLRQIFFCQYYPGPWRH